jgi:oligopeptide transport system permease protein
VSLAIGGTAMVIAVLGRRARHRRGAAPEQRGRLRVMLVGNIGSVLPSFVLGPVLVLVFAIALPWLPSGGWNDFAPRYMVLPIALLTLINVATIGAHHARQPDRGAELQLHPHRARQGPADAVVVMRHALRPALLPVVSVIGPLAIASITAAIVTESWFSMPGLGKLIVNGASDRDYTLVLGLVVLVTVLAVLLNLLVDLRTRGSIRRSATDETPQCQGTLVPVDSAGPAGRSPWRDARVCASCATARPWRAS